MLLALLSLLLTGEAHAEAPVTSQARMARAEFLPYAPAPITPAAVCLVDTGVDFNPDTAGAVVARTAIDGGSGEDTSAGKHGTLMTMVMAAPRNGWGMVGAWPGVRVVSVRALDGGYYAQGIETCRDLAVRHNIKVILLAAGSPGGAPLSDPVLADAVDIARTQDINVVAAAGNQPGPLDHPANYPAVFAVGAAGPGGDMCSFSASGMGLDLLAPGCELELAHPITGQPGTAAGTSQAAAFVAVSLAALRAHRPGLTPDEAEALLRQRRAAPQAPLLDVESTFLAAGLNSTVDAGRVATPTPSQPPGPTTVGATVTGPPRGRPEPAVGPEQASGGLGAILPRPAIRILTRHGRVELLVRNRPPSTIVVVLAERKPGRKEFGRLVQLRRATSRIVLPQGVWRRLRVRFQRAGLRPSPEAVVRPSIGRPAR